MDRRLIIGSGLVLALIAGFEGVEQPYLDVGGIPTVCAGHTGEDVEMDREYSPAECAAMLKRDVQKHGEGLLACIEVPIPQKTFDALLSFSYNVGVDAACGSTLMAKLNAGDIEGACNQLPRWNKAGGKVLRGLVRRRAAEQRLCLEGIREGLS